MRNVSTLYIPYINRYDMYANLGTKYCHFHVVIWSNVINNKKRSLCSSLVPKGLRLRPFRIVTVHRLGYRYILSYQLGIRISIVTNYVHYIDCSHLVNDEENLCPYGLHSLAAF